MLVEDRKKVQAELIYQIGMVLRPVLDVAKNPQNYSKQIRSTIRAQLKNEINTLFRSILTFCKFNGITYDVEYQKIVKHLKDIDRVVTAHLVDSPETLEPRIEKYKDFAIQALADVPSEIEYKIIEGNSPFSAYCKIKDVCTTSARELVYIDRYMEDSIFYQYLRDVPTGTRITLVTWPRDKYSSKSNKSQFDALVELAKKFKAERPSFSLKTCDKIHDRLLKSDDTFVHLGGSVRHAADKDPFTFSKLENNDENQSRFDDILSDAKDET